MPLPLSAVKRNHFKTNIIILTMNNNVTTAATVATTAAMCVSCQTTHSHSYNAHSAHTNDEK